MAQADLNAAFWSAGDHLATYDSRVLEPAEVLILARFREQLTGRVLDVGCGGGRLLGYLVGLGADAHGVDISSRMVDHCRHRFPQADVRVADLASLSAGVEGPFDVVLLSDNVLDVFEDPQRRAVLGDVRGLLADGGLIVFSSHNLAAWERPPEPRSPGGVWTKATAVGHQLANRSPAWMLNAAVRLPRRRANRRALGPLQYRGRDHAVVNDEAHDYGLLHYYISRADQERQLSELEYSLVEVLEFDGVSVPPGGDGQGPSLYYVAQRR